MGQGVTLIPLVRVSIINVGSGFLSKIWILVFLGKYSNIFVGSQSVSIEVYIIWYQSTGSKISFLSLLTFVSCYHPILFLLCSLFFVLILWRALGQNSAPSSQKKKTLEKILFIVSILSNQNIIFFCPLPLIKYFCHIFLPLVLV